MCVLCFRPKKKMSKNLSHNKGPQHGAKGSPKRNVIIFDGRHLVISFHFPDGEINYHSVCLSLTTSSSHCLVVSE